MRTGLVYAVLMTLCLSSFVIADTGIDSVEDEENSDYNGGPAEPTTKTDDEPTSIEERHSQSATATDVNGEGNLEASRLPTSSSTDEVTAKLKDGSCGDPHKVEHAKISRGIKPQYAEGDVVHYSCDFGYVTDDHEWTSTCVRSEVTNMLEWTIPRFNCIPRSCGDPGFVENGRRVGSLFTFPNQVSFECDEGFGLKGSGVRFCKTNGQWSGSLPKCEKKYCKVPEDPENGQVIYTSLEYGSELKYKCNRGFVLQHFQPRVCSENSIWSGYLPTCQEVQCERPIAPEHGTVQVVGSRPVIGTRAIYTCEGSRTLQGSPTSTCLDIGVWDFPTPKCLQPCTVPEVLHGKILLKERFRTRKISEGTTIKDGSELLLSCDESYKAFGTGSREEKISCNKGEWDRFPTCEPSMCESEPPPTPNARVRKAGFSRTHGSVVVYDCNYGFVKNRTGNVRCQFGTWNGPIPHCKDTRCDVRTLVPFKIKPTTKRYYLSQETLTPNCESGYSIVDPKTKIRCLNGDWNGLPCIPANCSENPPEIENGYFSHQFSVLHTSEVSYICNEHYVLKDPDAKVRCHFGRWEFVNGVKPTCHSNRCYTENLKNFERLSSDTESFSSDGGTLEVHCDAGYTSTGVKPKCVNGQWENDRELCKEDSCQTSSIKNGSFKERVKKTKCDYFSCWDTYPLEPIRNRHRVFPAGSYLIVSCDGGFAFHGSHPYDVEIKCSQGKWKPTPACLITGTHFRETTTRPKSALTTKKNLVTTTTTTTEQPATTQPPEINPHPALVGRRANCSCTYINADEKLAAFSGSERLKNGTLIKDGCKVRFHCTAVGYYRLRGPAEITCKDCRTWHSSEYPECDPPEQGDTILRFEGPYTELPGGEIGVSPGASLKVLCIPNGSSKYPQWEQFQKTNKVTFKDEVLTDGGTSSPIQVLQITDIGPEERGWYKCSPRIGRPISFALNILERQTAACPKFNHPDYIVQYNDGQNVNSEALISCKDPQREVSEPKVLTCLSNGRWSGYLPQCLKLCPAIQSSEGLVITYNDNRKLFSSAAFNCISPSVIDGVSFTRCKSNGEWEDPVPVCKMPTCKLEDLYEILPEYVLHDPEGVEEDVVPYNASVGLKCGDNRRLKGSPNTAKCKHEGKWEINKNIRCVVGCQSFEKIPESQVVIHPEEEFYQIGQTVTFSCGPGHKLTTEIERVMCLPPGWSPKVIPTCEKDMTTEDQGAATYKIEAQGTATVEPEDQGAATDEPEDQRAATDESEDEGAATDESEELASAEDD